ncbi:unnamed protein product (macronuclear) [Paramecium tetraurelia]|uniref:Major facilitator superfamily (MFS) profile domain-containing protein n=1 Tax=Paramecium tetraurelia TaxID=5888 RepID=A0CTE1_PARTE|nr:uncharacterized protein GSPATT00010292001 [Paramecium tetraurelia]CAK74058.1 unnamed protein product [Paramecium tetraurelia]|eukprot:XP_001441455.1 hypothetical protein (macronuclear) [Paramecium tetraurelia strain d4-2]
MKEDHKIQKQSEGLYQWIVLASFCLNSMSNIFLFTGLSPIWSQVAIYYGTTDYDLNWFTNMYYITLMSSAFLFNPLIIKYFGISQLLSCCFTSLGLWLLLYVKQDYLLGLVSLGLISLGESLYFQVPLRKTYKIIIDLSKLWFAHDQRIISTFIAQYSSNVGMLISYTISSLYFQDIVDESEFNTRYENLILFNAIFATIALVFNLSTLKTPSQHHDIVEIRLTIWESLSKLVMSEESVFDILSISSFIGLSWCYTMLLGTQQYYQGQSFLEVTQTSIYFQVGQIVAGTYCTWKLQKQSKAGIQQDYDSYIKTMISLGFWLLVFEIILFEDIPFIILVFINFFIGAGIGGIYSVLLEALMEKHFPVQELAIGTIFAAVASVIYHNQKQVVSITITMTLVIPKFLEYGFQISCYLMIIPFCYIAVFYKTQFKRFEAEA